MKTNKLPVLILIFLVTIFGIFAVTNTASAGGSQNTVTSCNSATITGTVTTGTPPTHARFTYATDYNTVSNGAGTPTAVQDFNTNGTFPIQQYISGLSQNTTYYYRLEVTNNYGTSNLNIENFTTSNCQQQQQPTVTLTANPTSVAYGSSSTLTWNSANATTCYNSWNGNQATSGTFNTGALTGTTNYTVNCSNSTGSASANATVTVANQVLQPTVTLTANPSSIQSGSNSTLSWTSTNATSCSASSGTNGWSGNQNTSGTFNTGALTNTTTYNITCTNSAGSANSSATVSVSNQNIQPTVNIYASPSTVNYNNSSTIYWNSSNANSCTANSGTNGWSGNQNTSGTFNTGPLTYTTTYSITCYGSNGQQVTNSATVYVNQNNYQTTSVNITADQSSLTYGGSTIIRWYPNNASYCYGSGGSNGWATTQSAYSGATFNTGPLNYTTTYSITCSSYNSTSSTGSVTVYIGNQPTYYNNPPIYNNPIYTTQVYNNNSLTVVTTDASQVLDTSAQLNSLIGNPGTYPTTSWFEWGTTINLGNRTTATSVDSLPSVIHTDTLSGLTPGTTYYFRAVATNSYTNGVGSILSFTTTGVQPVNTIVRYVNKTAPSSLVLITSSVNRNQPITPTIDNTRPHPGDVINYTVNFQNVGTASISALSLQVTLPQEVTYLSSGPVNPNILGKTLVFNLGSLKGNASGAVTISTQVNSDASAGTLLNFPAVLSYVDPSGQPQSVNANVTAQVWGQDGSVSPLSGFAFGAGFFPTNIFGWLILIVLILILILLAKYAYDKSRVPATAFKKRTTTTVDHDSLGKKITTTTIQE